MPARSHQCEVAVIGGGVVGLGFAIWLKQARPQTSVTVLERSAGGAFKIGESLTSSTTAMLRDLGLSDQVMRRLCRSKFGQSFWWTGYSPDDAVGHHLDSRVGETYHVERRPVEIALARRAERLGVHIVRGVAASVGDLGQAGSVLHCRPDAGSGGEFDVRARIVCDASGPAAVVPKALGHYREGCGPLAAFNRTAYYGYFRTVPGRVPADIANWTIDATSHICFPQGWMWIIALTSWEQTPIARLSALADHLLDGWDAPDEQIPPRAELAARFGCRYQDIVSIGVTVRDDDDTARGLPARQRFPHYIARYPGLQHVMDGFALVEPFPYGVMYKQRRSMSHYATQVAGDGYILVGDAAGFPDPLFSPGMKDGLKGARHAAPLVARALDEGRADRRFFAPHEHVVNGLLSVAFRDTEMMYRGFRCAAAFERTMFLRLLIGSLIILRLKRLPIPQPVWDPIWNRYLGTLDQVIAVERRAEAEAWPAAEWVAGLDSVIEPFVAWMRAQDVVQRARLGEIFSHYTDDLHRRGGDQEDGCVSHGVECPECRVRVPADLLRCPRCGANASLAAAGAR